MHGPRILRVQPDVGVQVVEPVQWRVEQLCLEGGAVVEDRADITVGLARGGNGPTCPACPPLRCACPTWDTEPAIDHRSGCCPEMLTGAPTGCPKRSCFVDRRITLGCPTRLHDAVLGNDVVALVVGRENPPSTSSLLVTVDVALDRPGRRSVRFHGCDAVAGSNPRSSPRRDS